MKKARVLMTGFAAMAVLLLADAAPAQDPAVVNARSVHVTLDNARVRVFEAELQPGDKEQLHSHPPYLIYVIAGGRIRNHSSDGKSVEAELTPGQTVYRDALTHWAENIGTTTVRLVVVELKN